MFRFISVHILNVHIQRTIISDISERYSCAL